MCNFYYYKLQEQREQQRREKLQREFPFVDASRVQAELFAPLDMVRPTDLAPVVLNDRGFQMVGGFFGFPGFASRPVMNSRIETAAEKPMWQRPLQTKRCLIPASGFYEWQEVAGEKKKRKWRISMRGRDPFALAGLYRRGRHAKTGKDELFFSILTTQANAHMAEIHNSGQNKGRQPMVIAPQDYELWLSNDLKETGVIERIPKQFTVDEMDAEEDQLESQQGELF